MSVEESATVLLKHFGQGWKARLPQVSILTVLAIVSLIGLRLQQVAGQSRVLQLDVCRISTGENRHLVRGSHYCCYLKFSLLPLNLENNGCHRKKGTKYCECLCYWMRGKRTMSIAPVNKEVWMYSDKFLSTPSRQTSLSKFSSAIEHHQGNENTFHVPLVLCRMKTLISHFIKLFYFAVKSLLHTVSLHAKDKNKQAINNWPYFDRTLWLSTSHKDVLHKGQHWFH